MMKKPVAPITVGIIATNCWIYPLAADTDYAPPPGFRHCAVIDPGAEGNRIIARLKRLKLVPRYILLTHGHFDHIAALPALAGAFRGEGGGPVIAIHNGDAGYLGPGSYDLHCRSFTAASGNADYIDALWEDMPPPDRTLAEGDAIGSLTVLSLPGHTPGSVGFWDREAGILFSGDTLFQYDYGRTDLPGGDEARHFESLRRLCAMDGAIQVLPGHGPATTIGEEAGRLRL